MSASAKPVGEVYVLDAHAVLALVKDEPGASVVERALSEARNQKARACICAVNLAEIWWAMARGPGEGAAEACIRMLRAIPVQVLPADERVSLIAGRFKAAHSMALGDCFAAAAALDVGAKVVTGDSEFRKAQREVPVLWIR